MIVGSLPQLTGSVRGQFQGVLVGASMVVFGCFVAIFFCDSERPGALAFLDNVHWTVSYFAAAWLAWIGTRTADPFHRPVRRWFALGLSFYAFGQLLWDLQVLVGWNPFPGPSDLFFLLLGACFSLGLLQAVRIQSVGCPMRTVALDTVALSTAVLAVTLALYLPRRGETGIWPLTVMVAYPVALFTAACIGVILVPILRLRWQWSWAILLGAVAFNGALWMHWNSLTLDHALKNGTFFNAMFSVTALVLGCGAAFWQVTKSDDPAWERRCEGFLRQLPLLVITGTAVAVILAWSLPEISPSVRFSIGSCAVAVVALAVARQSLLLSERDRLLEAERFANESQVKFKTLFDTAQDAILIFDEHGCVDCNSSALLLFGCNKWQMLGSSPADWSPESQADGKSTATLIQDLSASAREGKPQFFQWRHKRSNGLVFDAEVHLHRVAREHGFYLQATVRDISARKKAEAALKESEQRFRQVSESIGEVFWLSDVGTGKIVYVSPAYAEIWGRGCESLYKNSDSWLESIHPEDRDRMIQSQPERSSGGFDVEYRIVRPDGSVRWIHDRGFPVLDESGAVYRLAGVAEDITARRQLEEQLRQSQKMEAVGLLAGGIAHDFNNILAVIQMQAGLLQEDVLEPMQMEFVNGIEEASQRAANLTRQLLMFSRRQSMQLRDLNLTEAVSQTAKMLQRILGEEIRMEFKEEKAPLMIRADSGMMDQVLMNLTVNARDAMPKGGLLTIEVAAVEFDQESASLQPPARAGAFVCLSVSDTGMGIDPEVLPRIFEPFFTTKEVGKGTGLGLATIFGIVQQHKGWIAVSSEIGKGTTFRAYLPRLTTVSAPVVAAVGPTVSRGTGEAILVVEDDPALRVMFRSALARLGYQVLEASTGHHAVKLWGEHRERICLLLTDMVMPDGMSGIELVEALRNESPTLKVIYASGYNVDIAGKDIALEEGVNFLAKPFQLATLAQTVRNCLDAVAV